MEKDTHYHTNSLSPNARQLPHAARQQWTVENNLHGVLDVVFREDDARIRRGNGTQNMALLRHIAPNILERDTSNGSLKRLPCRGSDSICIEIANRRKLIGLDRTLVAILLRRSHVARLLRLFDT